jgi:hypothetical protein
MCLPFRYEFPSSQFNLAQLTKTLLQAAVTTSGVVVRTFSDHML